MAEPRPYHGRLETARDYQVWRDGFAFGRRVTDEMVERAAEALCNVPARHLDGLAHGDTDEDHAAILARAALEAALSPGGHGTKEQRP